jgi:hypothetical protein
MSAAVHDALKWTRITVMNWKHAAMIMTCVEAVLRNVPESRSSSSTRDLA